MGCFDPISRNEEGVALVTVLLFLVLLTIIGVSATSTSFFEQRISTNDRQHNVVSGHTNTAFSLVAKLINEAFRDRDTTVDEDIVTVEDEFYGQVKSFADYDDGAEDLSFEIDGTDVTLDVRLLAKDWGPGGSAASEAITGSQSVATAGGSPGVYRYYRMTATGTDDYQTSSNQSMNYIKVGENSAGGI